MRTRLDIVQTLALEAIVNFGRRTAGSAVYGGKQRRGRKQVSKATTTRRAGQQTLKALRSLTKDKSTAARDSQARSEFQHKTAIEKHKQQRWQV